MMMLGSVDIMARDRSGVAPAVYVFGVAQSFADTVCYMSSVQHLVGATFDKNGLLNDRSTYSASFAQHVESAYGQPLSFASLHFATSRKKIERQYLRVRSRFMKREHTLVKELPQSAFEFRARTYDYDK